MISFSSKFPFGLFESLEITINMSKQTNKDLYVWRYSQSNCYFNSNCSWFSNCFKISLCFSKRMASCCCRMDWNWLEISPRIPRKASWIESIRKKKNIFFIQLNYPFEPFKSSWLVFSNSSKAFFVDCRISLRCFSLQLVHFVQWQCSQMVNVSIWLQQGHLALTGWTSIKLTMSRLPGNSSGPFVKLITLRQVGLNKQMEIFERDKDWSNQVNVRVRLL